MSNKNRCPTIRVEMFPKDANAGRDANGDYVTIFGGVILSHMDTAGAALCREICRNRVVTVSFEKVVFKRPVLVGDMLTCWAEITHIGTTSITTKIYVEVTRQGEVIQVTEGEATYVSVDADGNKTPVVGWDGKRPTLNRVRKQRAPASCYSSTRRGEGKSKASKKRSN